MTIRCYHGGSGLHDPIWADVGASHSTSGEATLSIDQWLRGSQYRASVVQASHSEFNAVASPADDKKHGSHENEAHVSFVGRAHATATNFAFFAGRRYMEKGLPVPGTLRFL